MHYNIGLSTLLDWNLCQRLHYFRHVERLQPLVRPPALGSGSAVHTVLAHWLAGHPCVTPAYAELLPLVNSALADEFGGAYQKYVPGAMHALNNVPAWVWERRWEVETPVTLEGAVAGDTFTVHGRIDIWALVEEGVEIFDFKVTAANPLDVMLWTPQIRYYALALRRDYPDRALYYRYLLLPTKGKAVDNFAWAFTSKAEAQTKADLTKLVGDYLATPRDFKSARPLYTRSGCGFCDFRAICTAIVTGVPHEAVVKENFYGAK